MKQLSDASLSIEQRDKLFDSVVKTLRIVRVNSQEKVIRKLVDSKLDHIDTVMYEMDDEG